MSEFGLMNLGQSPNQGQSQPRAEPDIYSPATGKAKPRRTSDGRAASKRLLSQSNSPQATCDRITDAHPLTGDLAERQTAKLLVEQTLDHFGRVDILINNAGVTRRAPAVEYSDDDWDAVLEVNLSIL